jgi:hypothetical protein
MDAGGKQLAIQVVRSKRCDGHVGPASEQDCHLDAALGRSRQRAQDLGIRQEVSVCKVDPFLGMTEGLQITAPQAISGTQALRSLAANGTSKAPRAPSRTSTRSTAALIRVETTACEDAETLPASFRGEAQLSTWLFQVARSFCLKRRRRAAGEPADTLPLDSPEAAAVPIQAAAPDDEAHAREIGRLLETAIRGLPAGYREPPCSATSRASPPQTPPGRSASRLLRSRAGYTARGSVCANACRYRWELARRGPPRGQRAASASQRPAFADRSVPCSPRP